MKYKIMSFMVIVVTIISVAFMFGFEIDNVTNSGLNLASTFKLPKVQIPEVLAGTKKSGTDTVKSENRSREPVNNSGGKDTGISKTGNQADLKEKNGEKNSPLKDYNSRSGEVVKNSGSAQSTSKPGTTAGSTLSDKEKSISVFKVSPEKIEKEISLFDKLELASLASKISPVDYAKINNFLKEEDQSEGVRKTIALLKVRLSSKDYNKFKGIAAKFIDMEIVEKQIASSSS